MLSAISHRAFAQHRSIFARYKSTVTKPVFFDMVRARRKNRHHTRTHSAPTN